MKSLSRKRQLNRYLLSTGVLSTGALAVVALVLWAVPSGSATDGRLLSPEEMRAIFGDAATKNMCQKSILCDDAFYEKTDKSCYRCLKAPAKERLICCPVVQTPQPSCDEATANAVCPLSEYSWASTVQSGCPNPNCAGWNDTKLPCGVSDVKGGDPCGP